MRFMNVLQEHNMQDKRWCHMLASVMTVLALVAFIPAVGKTTASEQIVTVYKTPT